MTQRLGTLCSHTSFPSAETSRMRLPPGPWYWATRRERCRRASPAVRRDVPSSSQPQAWRRNLMRILDGNETAESVVDAATTDSRESATGRRGLDRLVLRLLLLHFLA